MPPALVHLSKDLLNEVGWYRFMEEIAHRVDEDPSWLRPGRWHGHEVRLKRHVELISVSRLTHCMKASRHSERVAVLTARTDLCAASYGIPSRVCPLDRRCLCHYKSNDV